MTDLTELLMDYSPATEPFAESFTRLNDAMDDDRIVLGGGDEMTETARAAFAYRHHHNLWVKRGQRLDEWWKRIDYTPFVQRLVAESAEYWREMEARILRRELAEVEGWDTE